MAIDRELLLGTDLKLLGTAGAFDLVPDRAGDLALATGSDNIVQVLTLRLVVRRGELTRLGWPDFGSRLHELIGEPNNPRTRVIAMGHARTAIERDPRVKEVKGVTARVLAGEPTTVRLDVDIELIHENPPLNLVFDLRLARA